MISLDPWGHFPEFQSPKLLAKYSLWKAIPYLLTISLETRSWWTYTLVQYQAVKPRGHCIIIAWLKISISADSIMCIVSIHDTCMYCILLPVSNPDSLCEPSQFTVHYDVFSGCQLQSPQLRHEHNVTSPPVSEPVTTGRTLSTTGTKRVISEPAKGEKTWLGTFWSVHPATYIQWNLSWETTAMRDHLSWKTTYVWQIVPHFNTVEPVSLERPHFYVWWGDLSRQVLLYTRVT